ncbi:MAG TPA: hypothetical protein IGS52_09435 [Oscillatoriaceae cyanobacterium M33_DOE_052]|nr:hypothetical protein [Oscillatoriaceae cyanobacterium M33_DOE_052]
MTLPGTRLTAPLPTLPPGTPTPGMGSPSPFAQPNPIGQCLLLAPSPKLPYPNTIKCRLSIPSKIPPNNRSYPIYLTNYSIEPKFTGCPPEKLPMSSISKAHQPHPFGRRFSLNSEK